MIFILLDRPDEDHDRRISEHIMNNNNNNNKFTKTSESDNNNINNENETLTQRLRRQVRTASSIRY